MRYRDSSALVPLFIEQPKSAAMRELFSEDDQVMCWTLSDVEVRSALARLERERALDTIAAQDVAVRFERFWIGVHVVSLTGAVKQQAKRLLGVHTLRAADALQLAAATVASPGERTGFGFVCLDDRLAAAARREGFSVLA